MLEELDVEKRLRMIAARLATQLDVLELAKQDPIAGQGKHRQDRQRRYYLQEQLKAIRKELGEGDADAAAAKSSSCASKLEAAKLPETVMKEADARIEPPGSDSQRLARIWRHPHVSPDLQRTAVVDRRPRTSSIWPRPARFSIAIIIDLDKVKRRIIEYLAVRKLKPDGGGAILCFVGPPGVGKTSLGKSHRRSDGPKVHPRRARRRAR